MFLFKGTDNPSYFFFTIKHRTAYNLAVFPAVFAFFDKIFVGGPPVQYLFVQGIRQVTSNAKLIENLDSYCDFLIGFF